MERSQELLDVYTNAFAAMAQGASFADYLSSFPDVSVIGTDPDELWIGRETVLQAFNADRKAAEGRGIFYTPGTPQAWTEGDIGWVFDRPTLRMPGAPDLRLRVTFVSHRESGTWKVVHQHVSIGVPNNQVEVFHDQ